MRRALQLARHVVQAGMSEPVSAIRNLGPAAVAAYARAGIHDARTLRALGAERAYARLLEAGTQPHFIGYCALVMGLQGRPWNDCRGAEKAALRRRFEALKAGSGRAPGGDGERQTVAGHSDMAEMSMERVLDRIGIRSPAGGEGGGVSPGSSERRERPEGPEDQ